MGGGGGRGSVRVDCTPVGKLLLVVQTRSVHSLVASHHLQSVAATMIFRFTVESVKSMFTSVYFLLLMFFFFSSSLIQAATKSRN